MISCLSFRERLAPGTNEPELLEHLRSCDLCLDHAVSVDADLLFRSLENDLVPPGGLDAFTAEVMQAVHLRQTQQTVDQRQPLSWRRRLAVAATLAAGISAAALVHRYEQTAAPKSLPAAAVLLNPAAQQVAFTTKPVVETYQSANATIVELPNDTKNDTRVVMIFDDKLPADL